MFKALIRLTMAAGIAIGCGTASALAQYPERPITMIVPYSAGGLADTSARIVAEAASRELGQTIVVENRAGAGGIVGAQSMMNADPDGYTIGWINRPLLVFRPTMDPNFTIAPGENYTPIALATESPFVFVTHAKAPFKTMAELLAQAKANPGSIKYGSPGIGTGGHLAVAMLEHAAGIKATHVPYQGEGPALVGLMSGSIDLFVGGAPAKPQIEDGTLVGLATTLGERWELFPDLPTVAESGAPDFSFSTWIGFAGPPNLPADIATKLSDAITKAIQQPETKAKLEGLGLVLNPLGADAFATYVEKDIATWQEVVDSAGLKMQ